MTCTRRYHEKAGIADDDRKGWPLDQDCVLVAVESVVETGRIGWGVESPHRITLHVGSMLAVELQDNSCCTHFLVCLHV